MANLEPADIVSAYGLTAIAEKISADIRASLEAEVMRLVKNDLDRLITESLADVQHIVHGMRRPQDGDVLLRVELKDRRP